MHKELHSLPNKRSTCLFSNLKEIHFNYKLHGKIFLQIEAPKATLLPFDEASRGTLKDTKLTGWLLLKITQISQSVMEGPKFFKCLTVKFMSSNRT